MAKEEKEKEKTVEGGKKKKMHLHQIRSVQAEDGSVVHHHTHKAKKGDPFTMPERENVATSQSPEEAGQHVEDSFAQNGQGAQEEGGEEQAEAAQGAQPMAGAGAAQPGA
jgi:hypothetical protein